MLNQLNPTLELHERVLADLNRRNAALTDQEAEARQLLERTLEICAAERTTINQERLLLEQAGQLYRRFVEKDQLRVSAACSIGPSVVPTAPPATPIAHDQIEVGQITLADSGVEQSPVVQASLVDTSVETQVATTIRDLRSQLVAGARDRKAA